jgi:hypothetical protein
MFATIFRQNRKNEKLILEEVLDRIITSGAYRINKINGNYAEVEEKEKIFRKQRSYNIYVANNFKNGKFMKIIQDSRIK